MSVEQRVAYWQRRCRDAEHELEFAKRENESTNRWAQQAFAEQRRLTDRLVHVFRLAAEAGIALESAVTGEAE